jgi:hypothetical protein
MAPELFNEGPDDDPSWGMPTPESDVYALGITLWEVSHPYEYSCMFIKPSIYRSSSAEDVIRMIGRKILPWCSKLGKVTDPPDRMMG